MWLNSLSAGLLLLGFATADTTSQSAASSDITRSTVLVTATASPTMVWSTPVGKPGTTVPYIQRFTQYFESIHQPMSGKIGLGNSGNSVGTSRNYPLTSAKPASDIVPSATPSQGSAQQKGGVLVQRLSMNDRGQVQPETWATVVALGGDTTWYGPKISQTSADTAVKQNTNAVVKSITSDTASSTATDISTTSSSSSSSSPVVPAGVPVPPATTTSTSSVLPPGVSSTSTPGVVDPAATPSALSTSTPGVPNAPVTPATTTSTSSVLPPGVSSTSTPGAQSTTAPAGVVPPANAPANPPAANPPAANPPAANPAGKPNPPAANPPAANPAGNPAANPPAANPPANPQRNPPAANPPAANPPAANPPAADADGQPAPPT